ncbi:MAG: hypothetical protein Q4G42_06785 [Neisseria sp.]|nr:hypothetical protein [Neisseria sp.]
MKRFSLLLLAFAATSAWAQEPTAQDVKDFARYIPAQHRLIDITRGDLNRDGVNDAVLVSVGNDPKRIIANQGLGEDQLNTNPRRLTILFGEPGGYRQVAADNDLIPSEHSLETPCLADPLGENGEIAITRGILKVSLHYWLSCGSYGVTNSTYTFRHEAVPAGTNRFRLIGFDSDSFSRNIGNTESTSINFLTGKIKTVTGGNEFEPEEDRPKTHWKNLSGKRDFYLDAMPEDADWGRIFGY